MKASTALVTVLGSSLGLATIAAVVFAQESPNSADTKAAEASAAETTTTPTLPDLNPGEGWQERAPQSQTRTGVRGRTWSDPAAGCHLALFALPVSDTVGLEPTRESLKAILANANLAVTETAIGPMTIAGDGMHGIAQLEIHTEPARSISLTACYWNEREPEHCQAICQRTLLSQDKVAP